MAKQKRSRHMSALGFVLAVLGAASLHAAEYFVNKQGSDASNGASRETAFLTVQKGVDALKPGDTLTIGPGEYFETVKRADLGTEDMDDDVAGIDQRPVAVLQTLDPQPADAGLGEDLEHALRNRADMAV